MGIDTSGGMLIGEKVPNIPFLQSVDDIHEWFEENGYEKGMTMHSSYFDCDSDGLVFGFDVGNIPVSGLDQKWIDGVKEKAEKFKEIFGIDARLIGSVDVC